MIYLFNKHLELTEVLKSPLSATMNRRLVGVDTLSVEESIKNLKVIEESSFAGAFLKNKFYIFKKDKHGSNNNKVYFTGINYAYDELANADVIKDRRLNNVTASVAISAAIQGTGWTLGTIQTTSAQTTNFYYETPLEAIKKVIELWQIEPDFYFDFDGKKIIGRKIDVMQQRGRVTGERFVYGSDILEIVQEEDRSDIVTALYGRGKGEEVVDEEGETTGGYSRRITFADVEWKKSKGDPVDKPLGQEYVELPSATQAYGYPKGDGTFKPRFAVYINEQLEEPLEVLKETYRVLVERSRPLVTFSATVAKAGSYDLGDTNYIIRPDLGLSYEARIFEDEIDLLNPDRTKFKFGDYIQSGQAKRLREIKSYFDGLTDKISRVESDTNGRLIKISKDWYDALMEAKEEVFFSGSSYNYSLENGNQYGLTAGLYSFDAPIDQNPTNFLVIQGGKLGRGSILPSGKWDFDLIGDADGITADSITTGKLKAQFVEIGPSSTFLEGYDPAKKANKSEVYTITQLDTKFTILDGLISSRVTRTEFDNLQIGGRNLIANSEYLEFSSWDNSNVTVTRGIEVPDWGATDAIRVTATSGDRTSNQKAFCSVYSNAREMNGKTYTLSVYVRNDRSDAEVTIHSLRFGSVTLAPGEMKRVVITGSSTSNSNVHIQIHVPGPTYYAEVTLWHPKLELGDKATDWTPSPRDIEKRVYDAEQKITATAITNTVSLAVDKDNEPLFAKTAETKLMADNWTAKFGYIGGRNLIKNSEEIDFTAWDNSNVTVTRGISVTKWGATNAIRVMVSAGDGTNTLKAYSSLYTDHDAMRGKTYTLSVYARNDRSDASVTIHSLRFGSVTLKPSEIKRVVITGSSTADASVHLQVHSQSPAHWAQVTLWHPQLELGEVVTDWRPHSDELYAGYTRIDQDGVTVGKDFGDTETSITSTGMLVKNKNGTTLLEIEPNRSFIPHLHADNIYAENVVYKIGRYGGLIQRGVYLDNVARGDGSGRDINNTSDNLKEALDYATEGGSVLNNAVVSVNILGTRHTGNWEISGYTGNGSIDLYFYPNAILNGSIDIIDNSCRVIIRTAELGNAKVVRASARDTILIKNSSAVEITRIAVMHPSGSDYPLSIENSRVLVNRCELTGNSSTFPQAAAYIALNSQTYFDNCSGNTTDAVYHYTTGSSVVSYQYRPKASNTTNPFRGSLGHAKAVEDIAMESRVVVPSISWVPITKTFTARLYRITQSSGYRTNGSFVQGTSPNNRSQAYRGYAFWGSTIYDWLRANGGYQNISSIKLYATRGGFGYGDSDLIFTNPAARTIPAIPRFGTKFVELKGYTLGDLVENSTDLTINTTTLSTENYADFTKIWVSITVSKRA